ncbi:MAG: thioredoxin domain-containing protein [Candidatus Magasanikbacteria bacterium]|nr:thioredoxin domain-containing protein [Candidatus Magasanikbacteria bacterium]
MRKVILWSVGGGFLILFLIFVWQMFHYYRLIKSGKMVKWEGNYSISQAASQGKKPDAAAPANLLGEKSPFLGTPGSKMMIVEFADFTCLYSRQTFSIMREFLTKHEKDVYFVFRHFPLGGEEHAGGEEAARAAVCAQEQGKFWAYHDKLFLNQRNFSTEDLLRYAAESGLDGEKFKSCLAVPGTKNKVLGDLSDGWKLGVEGTPTFFVNGEKLAGAIPLKVWEEILKSVK